MEDEEYTVLTAIRDLTETDRAFFNIVRFLDAPTRNQVISYHLRNTSSALAVLYGLVLQNRPRNTRFTVNIPLNAMFDLSGNPTFLEPVPVVPTREQILAGVETNAMMFDYNCAICQEPVTAATRLRACGHAFHAQCISQWFSINTHCPVCRHDIRDLNPVPRQSSNDSGMHANEE
jgi:hypothetical protein